MDESGQVCCGCCEETDYFHAAVTSALCWAYGPPGGAIVESMPQATYTDVRRVLVLTEAALS